MPHALPVSKSVGLAVAFACCAAMAQDRPATGHGADSPASQEALTKPAATPARTYDLQFATYFGGSGADLIRHMTADASGNIYVAGTAGSADFPRTPGAIPGASDSNGAMVAKFSPSGKLLWSKVCGTGKEIYFYTVIPDAQGNVFVAGRMGPGFPTTPGAIQPTTAHVCGFVGK